MGSNRGGRMRGWSEGGRTRGVGLEGSDWGGWTGESDWGGRTGGVRLRVGLEGSNWGDRTRGVGLGVGLWGGPWGGLWGSDWGVGLEESDWRDWTGAFHVQKRIKHIFFRNYTKKLLNLVNFWSAPSIPPERC